jgi:ACS family sodium-dependent inorganic phosphate cotransporter/ACS family sodium-dependent inorganic phosphate cotransporter-like MFS transporter 9
MLPPPYRQGLGEGVALPSMNNLVSAHVPPSAKARALGMSFTGFHTGGEPLA